MNSDETRTPKQRGDKQVLAAYVDAETARRVRERALAKGWTQSKWIAEVIRTELGIDERQMGLAVDDPE